jgi:hypothetical protein
VALQSDRSPTTIIEEWRDAERQLDEVAARADQVPAIPPPDLGDARDLVLRLREEYAAVMAVRRRRVSDLLGRPHSELDDDLRSVAEAMRDGAERLREMEELKTTLPSGDRRLIALAEESEVLANQLAGLAATQRDLAHEAVKD